MPEAHPVTGLRALTHALRPRGTRGEAIVAGLMLILGLGLAVSVRTNSGPTGLATARQEDLVRILDDLDSRGERLRQDVAALQATRDRLSNGGGQSSAALAEARSRAATLGILAGTVAAEGPGIVMTISDPSGQVTSDVLLDAIEELRDAGAEAIDLNGVRVVASTYVIDVASTTASSVHQVEVDGRQLTAPYVFTVIGDRATLSAAMQIPGGVVDAVAARDGAHATIRQLQQVRVLSLRPLTVPRYAQPQSGGTAPAS